MAVVGWIDTDTVQRRAQRVATAYQEEIRSEDLETLGEKTLAAYNTIIAALVKRGYTFAQINTWVERQEFQRDIATCRYLIAIGFQRGDENDWVEELCREDELEEVTLVDDSYAKLEPGSYVEVPFSVIDLEVINDNLEITLP